MRAILLFCEGTHDIAILRRLIRHKAPNNPWHEDKGPLKNFPEPLGGFLRQEMATRGNPTDEIMGERIIADLQAPDPPQLAFAARENSNILLLYRMKGETQTEAATKYLERLESLRKTSDKGFGVTNPETPKATIKEWAFGFVVDADSAGREEKLRKLVAAFGKVLAFETLTDREWQSCADRHDVGAFVWKSSDAETGTLEALLENALEQPYRPKLEAARVFLDTHKPGGQPDLYRGNDDVAKSARKTKAALVVIGQYDRPGQGLSTIIEHANIFHDDPIRQAFSPFLNFVNQSRTKRTQL